MCVYTVVYGRMKARRYITTRSARDLTGGFVIERAHALTELSGVTFLITISIH